MGACRGRTATLHMWAGGLTGLQHASTTAHLCLSGAPSSMLAQRVLFILFSACCLQHCACVLRRHPSMAAAVRNLVLHILAAAGAQQLYIVPLYMLACCPCVPLPLCTTVPVQAPEHSCHSQWPGGAHPNAAAGAQGQAHNCPRPGRDTPVHIPDRGLCWWGRHTAVGPSQPPRHKQPQQQRRRWLVLVFVIRQNQQRWRQRRQQKQQR
jgi:hypothetical protein